MTDNSDNTTPQPSGHPAPPPPTAGGYAGGEQPIPVYNVPPSPEAGAPLASAGRKKVSTGVLLAIIGGAVGVVLIIAGAIAVPFLFQALRAPSAGPSASGGPEKGDSPEQIVEGYLAALSDGDAKTALKYVDPFGRDEGLLTDEVLAASLKKGAIDDIHVGEAGEVDEYGAFPVPVEFTIGGEDVSREFSVDLGAGRLDPQIMDGLITISSYGLEGIGSRVNGVDLAEASSVAVFPGRYEFSVENDAFTLEGVENLVLAEDADGQALYDLRPVLSDEGLTRFRELVAASLKVCLASTALSTPCGMSVAEQQSEGYSPVDGTVIRTLTAEGASTLAGLTGEVSDRAVVTSYDLPGIDIALEGQNAAGARAPFSVLYGADLLQPKVDFGAEEPTVVWE